MQTRGRPTGAGGNGGSGVRRACRSKSRDVDAVGNDVHLAGGHAEVALGLDGDGGGVGHDGVGQAAGQAQRLSLHAAEPVRQIAARSDRPGADERWRRRRR